MTAGVRVAAFGALLAAIFALAVVAGRALGPSAVADDPAPAHRAEPDAAHPAEPDAAHPKAPPAAHRPATAPASSARDAPAPGGRRLVAATTRLTAGRPARFTFRIVDARGATVRAFETEQARRMHLIVVRRDLRRFQHVHPTQHAGGAWTARLTLPDAGVYHAFADFRAAGTRTTIGVDLFAAGRFEPLPLPAPSATARAGGYDVTLRPRGGGAGELRFAVRRDGAPVEDLEPYLGARGHLVMLRAGDLAYEHVHPLAADELAFDAGHAEPGTYRLFLQFRHGGTVHTAAFTRRVAP